MGKIEIIDKLVKYCDELKKHFSFKRVILYGSYARGTADKNSDIDIAIVVDKFPGDFFTTAPLLWKIASEVDSSIEPVLIEEENDDSGFLESISKYGEVITTN